MIVKPSDFQAEISIGQVEQLDVQANVNLFIEKYEPKFLKLLLGSALAEQLRAAMEGTTPEQKWIDLAERVKLSCANYIYYWYQRDAVTVSAGVGEVEPKAENAVRAEVIGKMVRAWNEMVELNVEFISWIDDRVYPVYRARLSDIFSTINQSGV